LMGAIVHHSPHIQKQSLPNDRAWFDWIYGHLFEFTPFSSLIWNPFYKFPLSPERIQQLKELEESDIIERLFNARAAEKFPEILIAIQSLIQQAKEQIDAADDPQQSFSQNSGMQPMDYMGYAAGAMIFYSLMDSGSNVAYGSYEDNMTGILPDDVQKNNDGASSSCSSCGTGGDGGSSCNSNDGGNDGGSGSGSDSSGESSGCSSSSCSSGCGGGGD